MSLTHFCSTNFFDPSRFLGITNSNYIVQCTPDSHCYWTIQNTQDFIILGLYMKRNGTGTSPTYTIPNDTYIFWWTNDFYTMYFYVANNIDMFTSTIRPNGDPWAGKNCKLEWFINKNIVDCSTFISNLDFTNAYKNTDPKPDGTQLTVTPVTPPEPEPENMSEEENEQQ